MAIVTIILLSFLLRVVSTDLINRDLLVIYGTGFGELRVTNINTKERIKTFYILIDKISGGLAINYEKDVIFFADKRTIYQLYLIDEFGNRTISGRGDLFTDTNCNHMEKILCEVDTLGIKNAQLINGLSFDRDSNRLFMSYSTNYIGSVLTKVSSVDVSSIEIVGEALCSNTKLQSTYKLCSTDFSIGNIPAIYISGRKCEENFRTYIFHCEIVSWNCPTESRHYLIKGRMTGLKFTIDKITNRLFVMQHGSINVLNRNVSHVSKESSFEMEHLNTLVADARLTKGLQAFDVHGGVVVWSSSALGKIFVGLINDKGTFIPYEDIYALDSTSALNSRNIIIF